MCIFVPLCKYFGGKHSKKWSCRVTWFKFWWTLSHAPPKRLYQITSPYSAWENLIPQALDKTGNQQSNSGVSFLGKHGIVILFYVSLITVKLGIFSHVYWPSAFFLNIGRHTRFSNVLHCFVVICLFSPLCIKDIFLCQFTHFCIILNAYTVCQYHTFQSVSYCWASKSPLLWLFFAKTVASMVGAMQHIEHALISLGWIPRSGIASQGACIL